MRARAVDRASRVLWVASEGVLAIDLTRQCIGLGSNARNAFRFDNQRRFVLDIPIRSLIIYIWYEGETLRQRIVKL